MTNIRLDSAEMCPFAQQPMSQGRESSMHEVAILLFH